MKEIKMILTDEEMTVVQNTQRDLESIDFLYSKFLKVLKEQSDISPQEILDWLNGLDMGEFKLTTMSILHKWKGNNWITPYMIKTHELYSSGLPDDMSNQRIEIIAFTTHREALAYMKEHFKPLKDIYKDWCNMAEYEHLVEIGNIEALKVDDKVYVKSGGGGIAKRHFAYIDYMCFRCFDIGRTSWTENRTSVWKYIKLHKDCTSVWKYIKLHKD